MHDVYATQDCSPSICLPKATTLLQETGAMCENQLIPSHWFAKRAVHTVHRTRKDCYGRREMKKYGRERSQAAERVLFRWTDARRTEWFPFCGVPKSGRVSRKGLHNEARI